MSTKAKKSKKRAASHHITDLSKYAEDIKKFDAVLKKHATNPRAVRKFLLQFDKEQERMWAKLIAK